MTSPSALRRREVGAAAVEYGLLLGLIAAVVLASVVVLGDRVESSFERTCRALGGGSGHVATPSGGGGGLATAPGLARRRC
jgi:pilus assembly protein Flp/PilA